MSNRQKSIMFSIFAAIFASMTAPIAAIPTGKHLFIVLPLVIMGALLLFAGYFAGLSHNDRSKK